MKKEVRGIVHNAFYKRNNRGDTKETLWGRTQSANMEVFKYRNSKEGKIAIVEREN